MLDTSTCIVPELSQSPGSQSTGDGNNTWQQADITFSTTERHCSLAETKLYSSVMEASVWITCPLSLLVCDLAMMWTCSVLIARHCHVTHVIQTHTSYTHSAFAAGWPSSPASESKILTSPIISFEIFGNDQLTLINLKKRCFKNSSVRVLCTYVIPLVNSIDFLEWRMWINRIGTVVNECFRNGIGEIVRHRVCHAERHCDKYTQQTTRLLAQTTADTTVQSTFHKKKQILLLLLLI